MQEQDLEYNKVDGYEIIQLEFLGLTKLVKLFPGKDVIQMYWNKPNEIPLKDVEFRTATLVEFRDSRTIVDLGWTKLRVFSLYKIY